MVLKTPDGSNVSLSVAHYSNMSSLQEPCNWAIHTKSRSVEAIVQKICPACFQWLGRDTDLEPDSDELEIQTPCGPEEMLERRLVVLKGIVDGEEVYLRELEALLMVTHTNTQKLSLIWRFLYLTLYLCRKGLSMLHSFLLNHIAKAEKPCWYYQCWTSCLLSPQ